MKKEYRTLIEGFKNSVWLYPKNSALVFSNKIYTYEDLYKEAKRLALFLLNTLGKDRLKKVAIYSSRTETSYITTLAVLLAGGAFVPLNPRYPLERNISILKQSNPEFIITDKNFSKDLLKVQNDFDITNKVYIYDEITKQDFKNKQLPEVLEDGLAYILFTSGSTGFPKGVPIKHKNVCSFLNFNRTKYDIRDNDRFSQTFEQTFDLSVFDLFMAWCHGASLYVMNPIDLLSPSKYINENKLTIWFSVPSLISLLMKQGFLKENSFPTLRLSLFCGEPLLETQMAAWANAAPNSVCENLYGPTELTIACSAYQWKKDNGNVIHNGVLSIGKLYDGLDYILINEAGEITSSEGELCVSGEQKFDGYLGLTKEVDCFIYSPENGKTYYKTGDRVRLTLTGELLYLGRIDQQVKIDGYRVDLGEIESIISSIEGIHQACVLYISKKNEDHTKKLVAYIVGSTSFDKVVERTKRFLPSYMIPSQIKIEDSFPLNPNGKIDRKALINYF